MPGIEVLKPQVPQVNPPVATTSEEPPQNQSVVGIIYPPPEVRSILFQKYCFTT